MNEKRDTLLLSLDQSIAAFATMRTPDAVCTAAFDTLKQARAMIARALSREHDTFGPLESRERAAWN